MEPCVARIAITLLLAGILQACERSQLPVSQLSGHAMGTTFHVNLVAPPEDANLEKIAAAIQDELNEIEDTASTYRDQSDISLFNDSYSTDWIDVSAEFCAMIEAALLISRESGGAFDITVGPLVDLWGFGAITRNQAPPGKGEIDRVRPAVGLDTLQVDCQQLRIRKSHAETRIDLSGWAKGHAVDRLARLLDSHGLENYLVEIGGEIKVKGRNQDGAAFRIAIEIPTLDHGDSSPVLKLSDSGIATSGNYRNFFEYENVRYSHAIDARTGQPIRHPLSAVTVIHPSVAYADAMATAILVLGRQQGIALAINLDLQVLVAVSTPQGIEYFPSPAFSAQNGKDL